MSRLLREPVTIKKKRSYHEFGSLLYCEERLYTHSILDRYSLYPGRQNTFIFYTKCLMPMSVVLLWALLGVPHLRGKVNAVRMVVRLLWRGPGNIYSFVQDVDT